MEVDLEHDLKGRFGPEDDDDRGARRIIATVGRPADARGIIRRQARPHDGKRGGDLSKILTAISGGGMAQIRDGHATFLGSLPPLAAEMACAS